MAKQAIKGRETDHFAEVQGPAEEKRKARERARSTGAASFEGKTFDSLSPQEKDDLLKTLAIAAGLIVE